MTDQYLEQLEEVIRYHLAPATASYYLLPPGSCYYLLLQLTSYF